MARNAMPPRATKQPGSKSGPTLRLKGDSLFRRGLTRSHPIGEFFVMSGAYAPCADIRLVARPHEFGLGLEIQRREVIWKEAPRRLAHLQERLRLRLELVRRAKARRRSNAGLKQG